MRDATASTDVLILFHNLEVLKSCFDNFAASESEDGSISLSEFSVSEFAMRAGFIGGGRRMGLQKTSSFRNGRASERKHSITGDKVSMCVTPKDIQQIFSASQNDRPEEVEQKIGDVSHYEVMTFSEFVETIARLGVMKFAQGRPKEGSDEQEQEELSYYECIKMAVEKACSIE